MKLKDKQTILLNHIKDKAGSADRIEISGSYGINYNYMLEYAAFYEFIEDPKEAAGYWINELFLQGEQLKEVLGNKFFSSSRTTQLKKARYVISGYMYY